MFTSRSRWLRLLAILFGVVLVAAACGGGDDGDDADDDVDAGTSTTQAQVTTTTAGSGGEDTETDDDAEADAEAGPASGTLRMVEFSGVTTFDPAGSQTAQSAFLYPVYDTLLLQNSDFGIEPNLATAWESPEPTVWEFTLRDDVVFHDGAEFNAQVAADNLLRSQAFEGNPNAGTFANLTAATAVDDTTLRVEFASPQPQFPMEMTMVMGMMVSPNAFDSDLTRAPAGSGPWVWDDSQSQAGVAEVFTLFEDYWDPAKQGVEIVEVATVADNNARLNAGLTGDAEIVATLRDAQIETAEADNWEVLAIQNYFPFLIVTGRDGVHDEELADERVRQAILYSIDRDAYVDAIHSGRGSTSGGIYPEALPDWYAADLDNLFSYDPDKAQELLTDAGYPDGHRNHDAGDACDPAAHGDHRADARRLQHHR